MEEKLEKISFIDPIDNEKVEFYVVETTKLNGCEYLLVTEEEGDSDCYIFKKIEESDDEFTYEEVEDDKEAMAVADVFAELLEDTEIV